MSSPTVPGARMLECALLLLVACTLDALLGDPVYALHPVRLLGKRIAFTEAILRRIGLSGVVGGILLVMVMLGLSLCSYLCIRSGLNHIHPWMPLVADIFITYSCIGFRDLLRHAGVAAEALEHNDLTKAQDAVQQIVGRDASQLDDTGVARAAVESVAENFVDGFLSPIFWYITGAGIASFNGLPLYGSAVLGTLGFRVINTMDSMVGYCNPIYMYFGWAAAKLDDIANFLPARLAIPIIFIAAVLLKLNARPCYKIASRDRLKHHSPNAGHAESCVAGALGIRLGGPTIYSNAIVRKPWLGDGRIAISHEHIRKCCNLILCSGLVALCISFLALCFLFS
jgi:adenosylcobinamide-phosphate synthase